MPGRDKHEAKCEICDKYISVANMGMYIYIFDIRMLN